MRSRGASEFSKLQMAQHALAFLLGLVLLFAACPRSLVAQDQAASAQAPSGPPIPYLGYFFRILAPREACPRRRKELPPGRQNGHEDLQLANPLQPGDSNGNSSRADDCVRQPETLNQQGLFRKAAR